MTMRRGDRPAALAGLRLRCLISFLRRRRLYRTAHAYVRSTPPPPPPINCRTGVFFDAEHLRRMLLRDRWAAASKYALSFVNARDCSREADLFNFRILVLRVIAAFAAGHGRFVGALFRRIYSYLDVHDDCNSIRELLLSMRSDVTKSSVLYQRIKPNAVDDIMDLVAKCPELKGKTRLPRSTFDPACNMYLGPRLWQHSTRHSNKTSSIPAHIIALSFVRKRYLAHNTFSLGFLAPSI
ncbi:hypothetical protein HU200_025740 [Digitaria exilis]|uniref:Uncharacterized protein n=1 Tax=Digitaria exilis TaxID=1010633 RepID=A0A835BX16_9POAL|nr:hypothetical protein HU200_025740 [Digitaria exilis]